MPKGYHIPQCSERDRLLIKEWTKSRTMESRLVERAKIIQRCLDGEPVKKIVQELKVRPNCQWECNSVPEMGMKSVPPW